MVTIAKYNETFYRLGSGSDEFNLYSFETDYTTYPTTIIKGIPKKSITSAYRAHIWVRIRGCDALSEGIVNGKVKVIPIKWAYPEQNVGKNYFEILEAEQWNKGEWIAKLPIEEIERAWEIREPYLDFPFPDSLEREVEITNFLEIADANLLAKRMNGK